MKLSILIPTYNYICIPLIRALYNQTEKVNFPVEIIVMDDASTDLQTKTANREINQWDNCRYIENNTNQGRAVTRNQLATVARGQLLLFMDCDAGVTTDEFLDNYVNAWKENSVVCGGLLYERPLKNPRYSLRYHYGIQIEEKSASKRQVAPYDSFTTFSFLIGRELFMQIKFNESFKSYGHEDTVFGYELQKSGTTIIHIDNPLYHLGLETNETFLRKTESSVSNLFYSDRELTQNTRLLKAYRKVYRLGLRKPISFCFKIIRPFLLRNLLSDRPNLTFFSLYKLGYICSMKQSRPNASSYSI